MSVERAYCFTCDWCGRFECYRGNNEKEAKNEAVLENWRMSGAHGCYCSGDCYVDAKRDMMRLKELEAKNKKSWEAFNVRV